MNNSIIYDACNVQSIMVNYHSALHCYNHIDNDNDFRKTDAQLSELNMV